MSDIIQPLPSMSDLNQPVAAGIGRPLRRPSYRDFLVYLAGPITGLTYDGAQNWREYVASSWPEEIRAISPLRMKANTLRPKGIIEDTYSSGGPLYTDTGIFQKDKFDCLRSDLVFFNFIGAKQVSIGTQWEMAWSHLAGKLMVVCIEDHGNPNDHAFPRASGMIRVNNLDLGILTAEHLLSPEGLGTPREIR